MMRLGAHFARTGPAPLWAALFALIALWAAFEGAYAHRLLATAGCFALAVLGYQFIFGHAGALSLAQGAFFGIGAYASALLALKLGWGFALTFPAAIAAAVAVGLVAGLPVLRLGSHYFALATLAVAQLVLIVVVEWESLTGGGNGLPSVPGIVLAGWTVPRGWPLTAFVWLWVALGALLAAGFSRSLYGDGFRLLRAEPLAAAATGLDGSARRLAAFLLSAGFGGAAGALNVHALGVVSPEALHFDVMVLILCMAVIGGRTAIAGAIVGALLLVHLPEWLRGFERWALFVYGAGLLAAIIAVPGGIAGSVAALWRRGLGTAAAPLPAGTSAGGTRPAATAARLAAGSTPALAVENAGIAFGGNRALVDFSLAVQPGEIVGLIGPNGSGKSTALNLVSGLYRPDTGRIRLGGREVTRDPPWRRARLGLGRGFQHAALAPDMSALDNVAVALSAPLGASVVDLLTLGLGDRRRARARAAARDALDAVGAGDAAHKAAAELTQAERRRVEIARVIVAGPRVVLLDEPAAGLSPAEQDLLAGLLRRLAARGLALIVVDHGMRFLLPLVQRVVCLDAGRILAAGTPEAVAADPEVRRAYLGRAAATLADGGAAP